MQVEEWGEGVAAPLLQFLVSGGCMHMVVYVGVCHSLKLSVNEVAIQ